MNKITIGKIRTSVGVRGYFKVHSFSGESKHFKKLVGQDIEISLDSKTHSYEVEDVRMSGSNLTMKVKGIDSPEEAKKLSGWEINTDRSKAAGLKSGEYYNIDLIGCKLVTEDGKEVGKVIRVSDNSVSDILEVEIDEGVRLIPFMNQYVGKVDMKARTIELLEEWLLQ